MSSEPSLAISPTPPSQPPPASSATATDTATATAPATAAATPLGAQLDMLPRLQYGSPQSDKLRGAGVGGGGGGNKARLPALFSPALNIGSPGLSPALTPLTPMSTTRPGSRGAHRGGFAGAGTPHHSSHLGLSGDVSAPSPRTAAARASMPATNPSFGNNGVSVSSMGSGSVGPPGSMPSLKALQKAVTGDLEEEKASFFARSLKLDAISEKENGTRPKLWALVLPIMIGVVLMSLTAYFSRWEVVRTSYQNVLDEATSNGLVAVDRSVDAAVVAIRSTEMFARTGHVAVGSSDADEFFIDTLRTFTTLAAVYVTTEDGKSSGARLTTEGNIQVFAVATKNGCLNIYDITSTGARITPAAASNCTFDPLQRPWYKVGVATSTAGVAAYSDVYQDVLSRHVVLSGVLRSAVATSGTKFVCGMDLHINAVSKQLDKQVPLLNDPLHASGIAFIVDFQGRLVGATTTQDDLLIDATTSIDPTIAEASGALKALYPDLSKVPAKVANMPVSGYSMTAMPLQLASRSNEAKPPWIVVLSLHTSTFVPARLPIIITFSILTAALLAMVVIGCWFGIELPDRSMLNGLSVLRTATLVLAIVSVGATYFAWEYSDAALLDDGVSDLVKQINQRVIKEVDIFLEHPRFLTQIESDATRRGEVNVSTAFLATTAGAAALDTFHMGLMQVFKHSRVPIEGALLGLDNGDFYSANTYGDSYFLVRRDASTSNLHVGAEVDSNGIRDPSKIVTEPRVYDASARGWFQAAWQNKLWSSVYLFARAPVLGVTQVRNFTSPDGQKGVWAVDITLAFIQDVIINYKLHVDNGILFIGDGPAEEFRLVASSDGKSLTIDDNNNVVQLAARNSTTSAVRHVGEMIAARGDAQLLTSHGVPFDAGFGLDELQASVIHLSDPDVVDLGWSVATALPQEAFRTESRAWTNVSLLVAIPVVFFSALLSVVVHSRANIFQHQHGAAAETEAAKTMNRSDHDAAVSYAERQALHYSRGKVAHLPDDSFLVQSEPGEPGEPGVVGSVVMDSLRWEDSPQPKGAKNGSAAEPTFSTVSESGIMVAQPPGVRVSDASADSNLSRTTLGTDDANGTYRDGHPDPLQPADSFIAASAAREPSLSPERALGMLGGPRGSSKQLDALASGKPGSGKPGSGKGKGRLGWLRGGNTEDSEAVELREFEKADWSQGFGIANPGKIVSNSKYMIALMFMRHLCDERGDRTVFAKVAPTYVAHYNKNHPGHSTSAGHDKRVEARAAQVAPAVRLVAAAMALTNATHPLDVIRRVLHMSASGVNVGLHWATYLMARNARRRVWVMSILRRPWYKALNYFVIFIHMMLAFVEASNPSKRANLRVALLAVRAIIILFFALDSSLFWYAFCTKVASERNVGVWRTLTGNAATIRSRGAFRFFLVALFAIDWVVHAATGYTTAGDLKTLMPFTVILRPVYMAVKSAMLRRSTVNFIITVIKSRKVAALGVAFIGVATVFSIALLNGRISSDTALERVFGSVQKFFVEIFVFATTASNYPDVVYPAAELSDGFILYYMAVEIAGMYLLVSLLIAYFQQYYNEMYERSVDRKREYANVLRRFGYFLAMRLAQIYHVRRGELFAVAAQLPNLHVAHGGREIQAAHNNEALEPKPCGDKAVKPSSFAAATWLALQAHKRQTAAKAMEDAATRGAASAGGGGGGSGAGAGAGAGVAARPLTANSASQASLPSVQGGVVSIAERRECQLERGTFLRVFAHAGVSPGEVYELMLHHNGRYTHFKQDTAALTKRLSMLARDGRQNAVGRMLSHFGVLLEQRHSSVRPFSLEPPTVLEFLTVCDESIGPKMRHSGRAAMTMARCCACMCPCARNSKRLQNFFDNRSLVVYSNVVVTALVLYLVLMAMTATNLADAVTPLLPVFIIAFAVEVALRTTAEGLDDFWAFRRLSGNENAQMGYFRAQALRFDIVVMVATVGLWIFTVASSGEIGWVTRDTLVVFALPTLRMFSAINNTRSLVFGLIGSLPAFYPIMILLMLIIFAYAVTGMWAFGGLMKRVEEYETKQANFDTFFNSFATLFQLLTGEDWHAIMEAAINATQSIMPLWYFFSYAILMLLIFANVLIGIVCDKFQELQETSRAEFKQRADDAARVLQRVYRRERAKLRQRRLQRLRAQLMEGQQQHQHQRPPLLSQVSGVIDVVEEGGDSDASSVASHSAGLRPMPGVAVAVGGGTEPPPSTVAGAAPEVGGGIAAALADRERRRSLQHRRSSGGASAGGGGGTSGGLRGTGSSAW